MTARRSRRDFFTETQFAAFCAACPPWLAAFARVGALTGMRPGELRRLERPNVTPLAGIVMDGAEWGLVSLRCDQTKTGEPRTIPLAPEARAVLEGLPVSLNHPNLYFLNGKGRPITKGSLRHAFTAARKRAGLAVARPHMLRHTTASWLLQRGVPLALIKEILGHRDIRTTEGYSHALPVHLAPALASLLRKAG